MIPTLFFWQRNQPYTDRQPLRFEQLEERTVLSGNSYVVIANQFDRLPADLAELVELAGGTLTQPLPQIGVAIALSDDPNFVSKATGIGGIRSVVPDVPLQYEIPESVRAPANFDTLLESEGIGNGADLDPMSSLQWGLDAIDAPEAWSTGATGKGVRVAVIDSGIVSTHPDIAPNLNTTLSTSFAAGESFEFIPSSLNGGFSHSTQISSVLAAADNDFGIVGVAPDAELVAIKVFSDVNLADRGFSHLVQSIIYAADIDADIANMSLSGTLLRSGFSGVTARDVSEIVNSVARATRYAHQQGTTLIASAGNTATDGNADEDLIRIPRDLPHVISVSATGPLGLGKDPTTSLDTPAYYTDYGLSTIDIAAPGGNTDFDLRASGEVCADGIPCYLYDMIISADYDGFTFGVGTSLAVSHVSGVAALIVGANGGDMNPNQVRSTLLRGADDLGKPGKDEFYGRGRVNALQSVDLTSHGNADKNVPPGRMNGKGSIQEPSADTTTMMIQSVVERYRAIREIDSNAVLRQSSNSLVTLSDKLLDEITTEPYNEDVIDGLFAVFQ